MTNSKFLRHDIKKQSCPTGLRHKNLCRDVRHDSPILKSIVLVTESVRQYKCPTVQGV